MNATTRSLAETELCCCRRNSVRLVIRKVQYAPEKPGPQPTAETTRQFLMSDKPLHLEASLDKEVTDKLTPEPFTHTHTHSQQKAKLSKTLYSVAQTEGTKFCTGRRKDPFRPG